MEKQTPTNVNLHITNIIHTLRQLIKRRVFALLSKLTYFTHQIYENPEYNCKRAESDEFKNIFKDKKIAVIWNSPNLVGKNRGIEIDTYDIVIRLNHWGLPQNLTQDTGYKTDIWGIWALDNILDESIKIHIHSWEVDMVFFPRPLEICISKNMLWSIREFPNVQKFFIPLIQYQKTVQELSEWKTTKFPSTWFSTLYFLLYETQCTSIDVYGFSFSTDHRILPPVVFGDHDFSREAQVIQEWEEQAKLKIH